jgi:hypothetical protein
MRHNSPALAESSLKNRFTRLFGDVAAETVNRELWKPDVDTIQFTIYG